MNNKKNKNIHKKIFSIIIFDLKESFKNNEVCLKNVSKDGRINSSLNEYRILEKIKENIENNYFCKKNNITIKIPKIREWYDFLVKNEDDSIYIPINLKITNLSDKNCDNLNCKLGIYYALTGNIPDFKNGCNWGTYWKKLNHGIENIKKENKHKDYYFLIVDKNDYDNIFYNSLKTLGDIIPNGNNMPFQCNWSMNTKPVYRKYEDSKKMILECLKKSLDKRAEAMLSFEDIFGEKYNT